MEKVAFITGVAGQDGSYLADLLLSKNYKVYGMCRRYDNNNTSRLDSAFKQAKFYPVYGDLTDQTSLDVLIRKIQPDEIYNLGAQSFVGVSWQQPELTMNVTGLGCLRLLEATRKYKPDAKFFQASSAEMFGNQGSIVRNSVAKNVIGYYQNERTAMHPRSPYGIAKLIAHHTVKNYRESYNMFACSGIMFNHESPRRGLEFVTRKITNTIARICVGKARTLELGNISSIRDWGYAPDYMKAAWLMLQQQKPIDYVIGTGKIHTIKSFAELAFRVVGISPKINVSSNLIRPAEIIFLRADASKIKMELGWVSKMDFNQLVTDMMLYDLGLEESKIYS